MTGSANRRGSNDSHGSPIISATDERLDRGLLRPHAYPALTRLGREHDGGYVIPEDQIAPCDLLISLGLNDDVSFDRDFLALNPGARAVGVDARTGWWFTTRRRIHTLWGMIRHTVTGNRKKKRAASESFQGLNTLSRIYRPPNQRLRAWVGGSSQPGHIRLSEILDRFPGTRDHDAFLKMDIEGAEYDVVPDIVAGADRIRCIAAELHYLDEWTPKVNAALRAMDEQYVVVHVHANNFSRYDEANGFPTAVEVTWLNRAVAGAELPLSTASYPLPGLDRPCDPDQEDYALSFG